MKHRLERPRRQPLLRFVALYSTLLLLCVVALAVSGCDGRQPAAQGPVQAETPPPEPARLQARQAYRNVPVLGELDSAEFDRTMQALTAWVVPQTGCSHCHVDGDAASDAKPAKATARRMLQMVQHINNWKPHVGRAGVTCQTCHQGQPRPAATVAETGAGDPGGGGGASPAAAPSAAVQAVAATGRRLLNDINANFMAGSAQVIQGTQAACSTCHAASGAGPVTGPAPARHFAALTLLPTEAAAAPATAVRAGPDVCAQAAVAAVKAGTRLGLELAQRPVVGGATLPLFSAPDAGCALLDLHLLAGDTVEAFVAHAGYTSVRYRRAATGSEARGWVRSERLGPAEASTAAAALATAPPVRLAVSTVASAMPAGCSPAPDQQAQHEALPGRARVLGQGRLQFFAVPDAACPLRGIFILPGEPVQTLQRAAGFIAVAYVNPRTGGRATGWVNASRVGLTSDAQPTLVR